MRAIVPAVVLVGALAGCGADPAPPAAAAQPPPDAPKTAKPALAAGAVGYDGAALQRSIDRMQQQAAEQAKAADDAAGDPGR